MIQTIKHSFIGSNSPYHAQYLHLKSISVHYDTYKQVNWNTVDINTKRLSRVQSDSETLNHFKKGKNLSLGHLITII